MSEEQGTYATEQEDSLNNARAMMGWDRPIEIQDDGDLRKYRIELPNLYDDSDLDPYEFRLLAHYKRVGVCTESTNTTAKKCKMSPMQVSRKRKALHKAGFIVMKTVTLANNMGYSYRITVTDKWLENFNKYSKTPPIPQVSPPIPQVLKNTTGSEVIQNIFTHYQNNIAMLTSTMADILTDAEKDYSADWVIEAITLAVTNNKRNWRYCEAILKRWKESGKDEGKGKPVQQNETVRLL